VFLSFGCCRPKIGANSIIYENFAVLFVFILYKSNDLVHYFSDFLMEFSRNIHAVVFVFIFTNQV
ncbi:MAG: hypothetical protein KA313_06140, partial [Pseudarcicella sp.]|nr:hypothetical protein [Pseudarcicella sp.]